MDRRLIIRKSVNKDINEEIEILPKKYNTDIINVRTEIRQNPSVLTDIKKTLGLENYSDSSFILYIILFFFTVGKLNDLFSFIRNVLILPKQITETYNFITKEDIKLLNKLDDLMNQLLGITGADRVAVAKIHNGTYDNTGGHEMKFSIIYEVLSSRAKPTKQDVQNIKINYIKDEIALGSTTEFQRVQRSEIESPCDIYLDKIGIACKDYKLFGFNKKIYGIVDLHWLVMPESNYFEDPAIMKRFNHVVNSMEDTLQAILLKTTWLQSFIQKVKRIPFKIGKNKVKVIKRFKK